MSWWSVWPSWARWAWTPVRASRGATTPDVLAGDLAEYALEGLAEPGSQLLTAVEPYSIDGVPAVRFILHSFPGEGAPAYRKVALAAFGGRLHIFEYGHYQGGPFVCDAPPWSEEAVYEHLLSTFDIAGDGTPTPGPDEGILDFSFEESRAPCQWSADCILMPVGGCGAIQAIHLSQVELAEAYTAEAKRLYPTVQCAPNLPIESLEPLCLNRKCRAVQKDYRLLLEVPEQPVAGRPFLVGISFRFHVDAEEVSARFNLPAGVRLVGGLDAWSGPVEAGQDYVIWAELVADAPGDIYLGASAGITLGQTGVPPVSWGEGFTVVSETSLTPQPAGERVLPTPTPLE